MDANGDAAGAIAGAAPAARMLRITVSLKSVCVLAYEATTTAAAVRPPAATPPVASNAAATIFWVAITITIRIHATAAASSIFPTHQLLLRRRLRRPVLGRARALGGAVEERAGQAQVVAA
jgi:hypothetical protein